MDEFTHFREAYPAFRRKGGDEARAAFDKARRTVSLDTMLTALAQHQRSEQWRKEIVPSMITWLLEERWCQVLPEIPPSASDNERLRKRLTPWQHAKRLGLK